MWVWGKSLEIPDRVGEFDPDAIMAEAAGRPFIIEYLSTYFGNDNLRVMYILPRYESEEYMVFELGIYNGWVKYGDDVDNFPFYYDDNNVVRNRGFVEDYDEVWNRIESMPEDQAYFVDEEKLVEKLFAYNQVPQPGDGYYNTPLRVTFATGPKAPASINRWYLQSHLG